MSRTTDRWESDSLIRWTSFRRRWCLPTCTWCNGWLSVDKRLLASISYSVEYTLPGMQRGGVPSQEQHARSELMHELPSWHVFVHVIYSFSSEGGCEKPVMSHLASRPRPLTAFTPQTQTLHASLQCYFGSLTRNRNSDFCFLAYWRSCIIVVVPSLCTVSRFHCSLLDVTHSTTQSFAQSPLAMSYYAWVTRCIPAFSICAVAVLLVLALVVQPHGREEEGRYNGETTWAQLVFSVYTVLLHIMSIAFPVRVCWSMVDMIRRMKDATRVMPNTRRRRAASIKSDEGDFTFPVPLFVIIIPAYKEEMETLETTLRVLASHSQARHCYHVRDPF